MVLLDTHTLVWLSEGSEKLGDESRQLIDGALQVDGLFVSTISFWEVAMLVDKGRLKMDKSVAVWRSNLMRNGLQEIQLTGSIAIQSAALKDFHGDPADRIITATAISSKSTLCTADQKILAWEHDLLRFSARR
ncbi:MAG: PIN domain nuclease of toxin-antitoxin system [Gammaproteobacteria bacterium]|jgi:PIN domain nuclease of toxin-antitoxin system